MPESAPLCTGEPKACKTKYDRVCIRPSHSRGACLQEVPVPGHIARRLARPIRHQAGGGAGLGEGVGGHGAAGRGRKVQGHLPVSVRQAQVELRTLGRQDLLQPLAVLRREVDACPPCRGLSVSMSVVECVSR